MEINADLYELLIAQGAPTDKAMAAAGGDHIYKNLATKVEIAGVKTEMAELRSEVKVEIAGVKTEIAELRSEVKVEIAGVKTEIAELCSEVKVEIAGVKTEIANEFKGLYRYLWGMAAGIVTVILSGIGAGILVLNMLSS